VYTYWSLLDWTVYRVLLKKKKKYEIRSSFFHCTSSRFKRFHIVIRSKEYTNNNSVYRVTRWIMSHVVKLNHGQWLIFYSVTGGQSVMFFYRFVTILKYGDRTFLIKYSFRCAATYYSYFFEYIPIKNLSSATFNYHYFFFKQI